MPRICRIAGARARLPNKMVIPCAYARLFTSTWARSMRQLRSRNYSSSQSVFCESVMRRNMRISTIPTICFLYVFLFCFPCAATSQNKGPAANALPVELTATDPEIRALFKDENISCKPSAPNDTAETIQNASKARDVTPSSCRRMWAKLPAAIS